MTYKIYYLGVYKKWTNTRDSAVDWIMAEVKHGATYEDFEILDGSDEL